MRFHAKCPNKIQPDLLLIWYVFLDPEFFVSGISFDDETHVMENMKTCKQPRKSKEIAWETLIYVHNYDRLRQVAPCPNMNIALTFQLWSFCSWKTDWIQDAFKVQNILLMHMDVSGEQHCVVATLKSDEFPETFKRKLRELHRENTGCEKIL